MTVAAPRVDDPGRISPFVGRVEVCDQTEVGVWYYNFKPDPSVLDLFRTESLTLDGVALDIVRSADKRFTQGDYEGEWWYAEGVPVLGVLSSGKHTFVLSIETPDGVFNFVTRVDVNARHC